jgi:predicted nucleotidyltransferase
MFGIYPETVKKLNEIFDAYNISEVIIYGSRAKGNYREGSDIDFTIKGNLSDNELSLIKNRIDESMIPYLFDLSIYDKIESESLKEHINRVGKIFYKR